MKTIDNTKKIKDEVEKIISEKEEYKHYKVEYILIDTEDSKRTKALASNYEEMIEINPHSQEIRTVLDWDYNIDEYIFEELEGNKKIGYMSIEWHYGMWNAIKEAMDEKIIEYKNGLQEYLKYCKENGITKEKIEKEVKLEKISDVMKYYKEDKLIKNKSVQKLKKVERSR